MRKTFIAIAAASLSIQGCALMPRESLTEPAQTPVETLEASAQAVDIQIATDWWTQFNDSQLNALVEKALAGSPNMELAKLRVEGARQLVNAELAGLMPRIGVTAQASQQRLSQNYIYMPGMPVTTSYGMVGGTLNWSLDLWGRQKKMVDAAKEGVQAAHADLAFTRLWLSATVVQSYVEYDLAYQLAQLAQTEHATRQQLAEIAAQRLSVGLADQSQVNQRRVELDESSIMLAIANQAVKVAQHQLAALTNQGPSVGESLQAPNITAKRTQLPEVIPADLLARRSDLQALLAQIKASKLRVDSAKLAYLPDINLQGLIGFQAFDISRLFNSNSRQYNVGPALNLPIFDGGAIASQISGREVERNQVIYNYQNALVNALKESADGILRVKTSQGNLARANQMQEQAASVFDAASQKRAAGIYADEQLHYAQLQYLQVKKQWIDARRQDLADGVNLIMVLGGPPEIKPAQ